MGDRKQRTEAKDRYMLEKTLLQMDNQEFLEKVDQLFEWLKRRASDGPIEDWTLSGIQSEIRRRIMEQDTIGAPCSESEPVRLCVESKTYSAEDSGAKITLHTAVLSRRGFEAQVINGLSRHEASLLLNAVKRLTSLGIPFEVRPTPFTASK